jgi:hypothetical protein
MKGFAMRSKDIFKGKYLKSTDVVAPIIATISYCEMQEVGTGTDKREKPVLFLENGVAPVVLNQTNFVALEDAFGDSDDWAGHRIKIRAEKVQYQGKRVDGIRVYPIKPKPAEVEDVPDDVAA